MAEENSAGNGNTLAAVLSFFVPGVGQMIQGRFLMGVFMLISTAVLWVIFLGWIIHIWSALDAAKFKLK